MYVSPHVCDNKESLFLSYQLFTFINIQISGLEISLQQYDIKMFYLF